MVELGGDGVPEEGGGAERARDEDDGWFGGGGRHGQYPRVRWEDVGGGGGFQLCTSA